MHCMWQLNLDTPRSLEPARRHLGQASIVLVTVNSAVNFIVYCMVSRTFRDLLVRHCCRCVAPSARRPRGGGGGGWWWRVRRCMCAGPPDSWPRQSDDDTTATCHHSDLQVRSRNVATPPPLTLPHHHHHHHHQPAVEMRQLTTVT